MFRNVSEQKAVGHLCVMTVSGVTIEDYIIYLCYVILYFLREGITNLRSDTTRKPKDNFAMLNNICNGGIFLLGWSTRLYFSHYFSLLSDDGNESLFILSIVDGSLI